MKNVVYDEFLYFTEVKDKNGKVTKPYYIPVWNSNFWEFKNKDGKSFNTFDLITFPEPFSERNYHFPKQIEYLNDALTYKMGSEFAVHWMKTVMHYAGLQLWNLEWNRLALEVYNTTWKGFGQKEYKYLDGQATEYVAKWKESFK